MKTKKSSLLVFLTLVVVFALVCSAWAVTGQQRAGAGQTVTVADHIATTADGLDGTGAYALNGGTIQGSGRYNVTTSGAEAAGVYAYNGSSLTMSSDIKTTGESSFGARSYSNYSKVFVEGTIETTGDLATGAYAQNYSYLSMNGPVATSGYAASGVFAFSYSSLDMIGNVTTTGDQTEAVRASSYSYTNMTGNVSTSGYKATGAFVNNYASLIVNGAITTAGEQSNGVHAYNNSNANITGNVTTSGTLTSTVYAGLSSVVTVDGNVSVNGTDSYGLDAVLESTINMKNGTLAVVDEGSAGIRVEDDGVVNLNNVTTDAQSLLATTTSGTLNAEDSELVGDVLHGGIGGAAETLEINLKDSTLEGAILTSPGIGAMTGGVVDLDLENSTWLVTGDSSTNGKVTGDINSAIDYTEAPGETTVTIDEIVGNPTITLKPGDGLNITNSTGNNGDFSSSNPDVLEVVTNPDGSVEIISKGEGDADLTYSYTDSLGGKHTVTVDASPADPNGTGSTPGSSRSGGSSSGCNAGFGALFALLGLAVVAKKK